MWSAVLLLLSSAHALEQCSVAPLALITCARHARAAAFVANGVNAAHAPTTPLTLVVVSTAAPAPPCAGLQITC